MGIEKKFTLSKAKGEESVSLEKPVTRNDEGLRRPGSVHACACRHGCNQAVPTAGLFSVTYDILYVIFMFKVLYEVLNGGETSFRAISIGADHIFDHEGRDTMSMNEMIIISVDDHICEPPGFLDQHLAAKYLPRAPKCIRDKRGLDIWRFDESPTPLINVALNAVAGRPKEELGMEPNSFDHIRKGCFDVKARIDDMNVNGILASVNFPNTFGFAFDAYQLVQDKKLALALLQAHNDYHLDEWGRQYPNRFIPLCGLPLWDPAEMVREVKRTLAKGMKTVTFPSFPKQLNFPSIHDPYWKPLWDVLNDEGVPLSIHLGVGGGTDHLGMDSPLGAFLNKVALSAMSVAAEWLWSAIPRKYSNLKIVLSEGGIGWLPYFLERADLTYQNHGPWMREDWGKKLPSDVFREHFVSCFIVDKVGVKQRDFIGIDTITFENDYPHADVTWPQTPEQLWEGEFENGLVPKRDIDKITHQNALRVYNFDPFSTIDKADCTVGALRAKAKDVDLTLISGGGIPPSTHPDRSITAGDVIKQFAIGPSVIDGKRID